MNDDSAPKLRHNKLLVTNSLTVSCRDETWTFKAKGKRSELVNMGLVFAYKVSVSKEPLQGGLDGPSRKNSII